MNRQASALGFAENKKYRILESALAAGDDLPVLRRPFAYALAFLCGLESIRALTFDVCSSAGIRFSGGHRFLWNRSRPAGDGYCVEFV